MSDIELECKLPIESRKPYGKRILALGGKEEREVFERNWVLDDAVGSLKESLRLLRVRQENDGADALVTLKAPAPEGEFKTRLEIQTRADSCENAIKIFHHLGYEPIWYYEKKRRYYIYKGCEIALDKLPEIGCFIEVEGHSEDIIREILADLDLDSSAHLRENYLLLFKNHCEKNGEEFRDMKF